MAKDYMKMFEDEEKKSKGVNFGYSKPKTEKKKKEKIPMVKVEEIKKKMDLGKKGGAKEGETFEEWKKRQGK